MSTVFSTNTSALSRTAMTISSNPPRVTPISYVAHKRC
jgi:hypothetical protein